MALSIGLHRIITGKALLLSLAFALSALPSHAPAQMNPCPYTNDGDCDEPNGLGYCAWGTDTADCSNPNSNFGAGSGYIGGGSAGGGGGGLYNPCPYTNDGDCDEPNGLGYCAWGTDTADCSNPNSNFGSGSGYSGGGSLPGSGGTTAGGGQLNPCPYTYDRVCDEPNGTGRCAWGTDSPDCDGSGNSGTTVGPPCGGQVANLEWDPVTLQNFADRVGQCLSFPTTGFNHYTGGVWGGANGIYALNSTVGMAAVHAGVLSEGQRARVVVEIIPQQGSFAGSYSNGVQSGTLDNAAGYGRVGFRFIR